MVVARVVVLRLVRVAVPRVGVVGVEAVVSDPRGFVGRWACAGRAIIASTKASSVESKIDFFIADALIMSARKGKNYPTPNFLPPINLDLTFGAQIGKKC